ncbi:hypothetical protein ACQJBY_042922 [Aegilops geniculata]
MVSRWMVPRNSPRRRPSTTSSTWCRGGSWCGDLKEDAANVNIIKLEHGGVELAEMPSRAMEDGDTKLARTTPVVFFIKLAPWRTDAWSSRECRRRAAVHGDTELARTFFIINIIKLVSRRTEAWSSRDDTTDV